MAKAAALVFKKRTIQLSAAALALGAVTGLLAAPVVALAVLGIGLAAAVRWRGVWIVALMLGLGVLRGFAAPHDLSKYRNSEPALTQVLGLGQVKAWMTRSVDRALPSPEAPLLAGLLLGSRQDLPSELRNAFRLTGTSHIVAVSGFNVTIVVTMIAALVRIVPAPPWVRTSITLVAITAFVLLTGASASVVRAGIMGSLVVLARATGRLSDGLHALALSAGAMVLVDPRTISSVGFQLSVAATAGLFCLSEPLERRLAFVPEALGIRSSLASTLAAIALTQPIILLYFGQASLVAPLVNLLVLPLVPLAMLTGFCVAVLNGIVPALGAFVAWIAWAPLKLMVSLVSLGAAMPLAALQLSRTLAVLSAVVWAGVAMYFVLRVRSSHAIA